MDKATEQQIQEAAKKFANGATLKEVKGISNEELESVYSLGFSYYRTGKFENAQKLFEFLVLFDHLNAKYWTGMGAVYQMQKRYGEAVTAYGYASFLDLHNPKPQYFAAECFAAMGDKVNALSALAALETYCPKETDLGREYLEKAAELKAILEK